MNDLFNWLGILRWKGLIGELVLPPLPFLLLALYGAWRLPQRRVLGWAVLWVAGLGIWLSCTTALGWALVEVLTRPPPALSAAQRTALVAAPRTAIVVLGAGRRLDAPEYEGTAQLKPMTLERLRYALWLARQTRLPVMYSGGVGHGSPPGPTEADIARRVAEREFGVPLRWVEDQSRDTNENARFSVTLLQSLGIERVVLVTHDFHQRRALAAFTRAMEREGIALAMVPAPLGMRARGPFQLGDWLPTADGFALTRLALHEWLGRIAGA